MRRTVLALAAALAVAAGAAAQMSDRPIVTRFRTEAQRLVHQDRAGASRLMAQRQSGDADLVRRWRTATGQMAHQMKTAVLGLALQRQTPEPSPVMSTEVSAVTQVTRRTRGEQLVYISRVAAQRIADQFPSFYDTLQ
ncbi:MAG TPA: hypothetical protein P5137_11465 [Candidatus Brocadiia bacterium]|nr:hypothetical protein [Candidatus Brocadiia bacterium]